MKYRSTILHPLGFGDDGKPIPVSKYYKQENLPDYGGNSKVENPLSIGNRRLTHTVKPFKKEI